MVATLRSETFGQTNTVTISLKQSVLEGLELRISFAEGKGLRAEFLTSSLAVSSLLNERLDDLRALCTENGINFNSIDVSTGGSGANANHQRQESSRVLSNVLREGTAPSRTSAPAASFRASETSYIG